MNPRGMYVKLAGENPILSTSPIKFNVLILFSDIDILFPTRVLNFGLAVQSERERIGTNKDRSTESVDIASQTEINNSIMWQQFLDVELTK
jgi:hypothetical protein